jgi:hypothetical protein
MDIILLMEEPVRPDGMLDFEHKRQPLLHRQAYIRRIIYAVCLSALLLALWTIIGMVGYHFLANLSWVDSFLNAAMIVGGMGPVDALSTPAAKLFAGFYAIFSGVIFLSIFSLLVAPVYHRFLHKFHLESGSEPKHQKP